MPAWILYAIGLGVASSAVLLAKLDVNLVAMRFFRDLSRSKARKRLYGNKHALMPLLLGMESPLEIKTIRDEEDSESLSLTREDLEYFDGHDDDAPLYLSIAGRVYDVSAGAKFYGKGGKYHLFVGTDATRAFATGCLQPECVSSSTEGLSDKEMKEIQRWLELYETHDKYTFVGYLVDDPVDAALADDEHMDSSSTQEEAVS